MRLRATLYTWRGALYYLDIVKHRVLKGSFNLQRPDTLALNCERRMFVAALTLASKKYLKDRKTPYSKHLGLSKEEIFMWEMTFLQAIDWDLDIPRYIFG